MPEPDVAKFADKLAHQREIVVDYRKIEGADHFFNDHIDDFSDHIDNYLASRLGAPAGS